jgi:peptidoglycan hydrolase-like protein with peptidoglycan-binding domain
MNKCNKCTARLPILFATLWLVSGCQTPAPSGGGSAASAPAPATAPAAPAATAPAAATPEPGMAGKAPEPTPAQAPATTMTVAEMQKRLNELGYQAGPADGKSGPRTVNALKKFQHDHNLPVTGQLDAETVIRLQQPK